MPQEELVLEVDLAGHRPIDRFEADIFGIQQAQPQWFEARCIVRIVGQHMTQDPAPGVILPGITRGIGHVYDLSQLFRILRLEVLQHDVVAMDSQALVRPILTDFRHAFGVPRGPSPAERQDAVGVDGLVLWRATICDGIDDGLRIQNLSRGH